MKKSLTAFLLTCGMLSAQTPAQERRENLDRTAVGLTPIYRVTVTERTTKAISYRNRSGATKIDFAGTAFLLTMIMGLLGSNTTGSRSATTS